MSNLIAQETSTDSLKIKLYHTIESFESQIDDNESVRDFNTLFEHLEILKNTPLDLNNASKDDLIDSRLFSERESINILNHRVKYHRFVEIEELKYLGISEGKIEAIIPFVTLKKTSNSSLKQNWHTEYVFRLTHNPTDRISNQDHLGAPFKHLSKLRFHKGRKIQFGFTLEKDPGEEFFKGFNTPTILRPLDGFDFNSFHFHVRPGQKISQLAIGDYNLNIGQGLTIWNGFSFGKSALISNIKREGPLFSPYTSAQENNFMRGVAVKMNFRSWSQSIFISNRKLDANVTSIDSTGDAMSISSFQTSGLHRTISELYDESSVRQKIIGHSLKKNWLHGYVALNNTYQRYDTPIAFSKDLNHSSYELSQDLILSSIDYKLSKQHYGLFGELAVTQSGAIASIHALELFLQSSKLIFCHRNYSPSYYVPTSNGFSDKNTRNEKGFYFGADMPLTQNLALSTYLDSYKSYWPSISSNFNSHGNEFFSQLRFTPTQDLDMYVRSRVIWENGNERTTKSRIHITKQITKRSIIRTRYEWTQFKSNDNGNFGYLLYQDLVFYIPRARVTTSLRVAVFNSQRQETTSYAFENDVLYSFSIPSYNGTGMRYYGMVKWNPKGSTQYWFRLSQTIQADKTKTTQFKFQMTYSI